MTRNLTALLSLMLCLFLVQVAGGAVVFGVVPSQESSGQGVVVGRVAAQTPAHAAGLQAGDVIEYVQGESIPHVAALKAVLAACSPGDVLRVRYRRGGRLCTTLVELAARPGRVDGPPPAPSAGLSPEAQLQFAQARSRLRIQLARLPHRMNLQQVHADLQEMLTLARRVPAGCHSWLQGSDVQMSLRLDYSGGAVELHSCNGALSLAVPEPGSNRLSRYPINTPAERTALPAPLLRLLQQF